MPLLPLASMVSDEDLQERWAILMETTATGSGSLPSFGQTLSQLTAEAVQYLERLWEAVSKPTNHLSEHRFDREPLSLMTLMQVFDLHMNTGVNPAEQKVFEEDLTDDQKANYERVDHAELVIQDLIRLGILIEDKVPEPDRYLPFGDNNIPFLRSKTTLRAQYSFSQYGVTFMRAVAKRD
jgi:hypothetical protein